MIIFRVFRQIRHIALFFLIAVVTATICNFSQWNYLFIPPSLDPMIKDFKSVESLGHYDLEPHSNASGYMAINGDQAGGEYGFFANASEFIVDYDVYRIPRWAQSQSVDRITPLNEHMLTQLEQLVAQLNWPVEFPTTTTLPDNLPADSPALFPVGYVIQGRDTSGNDLMLVSMVRMISDDSYGYHEALFQMSDDDVILLETNDYNYDIAGVEFAQWPFWFLFASLGWYVVFLIGLLVVKVLNNQNDWSVLHS